MQNIAPLWQPWLADRATERAAALIKQYDDGLIEKLSNNSSGSERERRREKVA